MLLSSMVTVRTNTSQIWLTPINKKSKTKIIEMAEHLISVLDKSTYLTKKEIDKALKDCNLHSKNRKLFDSLRYLLEKKSEYMAADSQGQKIVFLRSTLKEEVVEENCAEFRLGLFKFAHQFIAQKGRGFSAAEILQSYIEEYKYTLNSHKKIESSLLYADLKENWRLLSFQKCTAQQLFEEYQLGRVQAVLLKSKYLKVSFMKAETEELRYIFRQLKFRELLHQITYSDDLLPRVEIRLDGPFSLFEARTKYGLRLALALPLFLQCTDLKIEAEIEWKKGKKSKIFEWRLSEFYDLNSYVVTNNKIKEDPKLQEFEKLIKQLKKTDPSFDICENKEIIAQPGFSVLIPEISIKKKGFGTVYCEFFKNSSRAAIVARVEMIEQGFPSSLLLIYPEKCRISEDMLSNKYKSRLYSYKRTFQALRIIEKVQEIRAHSNC